MKLGDVDELYMLYFLLKLQQVRLLQFGEPGSIDAPNFK